MMLSIFQVSRESERWLTASARHFTLCGIYCSKGYFLDTVRVLQLHMWETTAQL